MHTKAMAAILINMQFSRDFVFEQGLVKNNAVVGAHAAIIGGMY